jgi:hypothetical protein
MVISRDAIRADCGAAQADDFRVEALLFTDDFSDGYGVQLTWRDL